jgi:hypothetical protein
MADEKEPSKDLFPVDPADMVAKKRRGEEAAEKIWPWVREKRGPLGAPKKGETKKDDEPK